MNIEQKLKMALAYANITKSELARRLETSPQNFNQRLKRGGFSVEELEKMAEKIGATLTVSFEFPDGTKV